MSEVRAGDATAGATGGARIFLYKEHARISMGKFRSDKRRKRDRQRSKAEMRRNSMPENLEPDTIDRALTKAKEQRNFSMLIEFMKNQDHTIRCGAAAKLGDIDGLNEAAINALIGAINDSNHLVRKISMQVLRKIGPAAHKAVPSLIHKLRDSQLPWYEKIETVDLLGRIGKESYTAIPLLLKAVRSDDENMRVAAAISLGMIGSPVATEILETLAVNDPNENVKDAALKGLMEIHRR